MESPAKTQEQPTMQEGPMSSPAPGEAPPPKKAYEDMSPDELRERVLFERMWSLKQAGVDQGKIDGWKNQYGRVSTLFATNKVYVYRPIFRAELRELRRQMAMNPEVWRQDLDFEEQLVHRCTLSPKLSLDYLRHQAPAGLVNSLAEAIQALSEFGAQNSVVEL